MTGRLKASVLQLAQMRPETFQSLNTRLSKRELRQTRLLEKEFAKFIPPYPGVLSANRHGVAEPAEEAVITRFPHDAARRTQARARRNNFLDL